jgi:murein DD-endopeptidase MepM/ murein hydrolase activator NlpD
LASVSSSNLNNWSQANNPSPVTSIQSSVNPHLEKLEADLGKLQQNVPHQPNSSSQTIPIAVEPVVAQVSNPTPVESESVNPEWVNRSNANPKSLSVQPKENFPQSGQHRTVGIGNNNPSVNSSQSQSQLVGSIPIPVENYNPMLRTPVGESVGPDLPSLSAPDQFLPNTPSQFTGYQWPAKGVLTSGYGPRWGRMHKGIDIAAPVGTPITASASGEVISAGWNNGGYGNLVKIRHADGSVTLYAHNSRILVRPGQIVEQGQLISEMGSTGFSTGPHLHFEIHPSGKGAVNPIAFLPRNRS